MEELTYIKQEVGKLVDEINAHPLTTDDLRRSYLELTLSSFNLYYIEWDTIYSAKIIRRNPPLLVEEERYILTVFTNSVFDNVFYRLRTNSAYRALLTDSWSMFEFCLTYLCEELLDEKMKTKLLNDDSREVSKVLTEYELSEPDKLKIKKILREKKHLTHVPVPRKYDKIYSLYKDFYTGDWSEDRSFLDFYGTYRNCMHTNYIYHGEDKEYTFLETTYYFINGKAISHNKEETASSMLNLAIRLKTICRKLFDAIQYPGLLRFPVEEVLQP